LEIFRVAAQLAASQEVLSYIELVPQRLRHVMKKIMMTKSRPQGNVFSSQYLSMKIAWNLNIRSN
jgi:hypothetical protein